MGVNKQLQVPGVCEPVVAAVLVVELKVKAVVEGFLGVVCVDLVVGVIELVVGGFVLCHLLLDCGCVGCELSRLCLDWLGCDLTLVELTLPW